MPRRTKRRKRKRNSEPVQKRLTTAQRWKWGLFFALASGTLFFPYVMNAIHERNVFSAIVLAIIGSGALFAFIVTMRHH